MVWRLLFIYLGAITPNFWGTIHAGVHYSPDTNEFEGHYPPGPTMTPMIWGSMLFWGSLFYHCQWFEGVFFLPGGHYTNYLREHSPLGTTIPLAPVILGDHYPSAPSIIPMIWGSMLFWGSLCHRYQWFEGFFFCLPGGHYTKYLRDRSPLGTTIPLTPTIWGTIIPYEPL